MKSTVLFLSFTLLFIFAFFISTGVAGDEIVLKVGDPAPSFMANDQNGNLWKSSDHIGKGNLIIYFYPVALTGG